MGCGCAERKQAIVIAAGAAFRGDVETVKREVAFVGRSALEDARAIAQRAQLARVALAHRMAARR
jgi:hypothetical protein